MPGQISIVGFSRFIFRILRGYNSGASVEPLAESCHRSLRLTRLRLSSAWQPQPPLQPGFSIFKLATHRGSLAESGHEDIYPTDYNSVSDVDRNSLICANNLDIARGCIGPQCNPTGSVKRPAEPAGNDEANDGAGEVE